MSSLPAGPGRVRTGNPQAARQLNGASGAGEIPTLGQFRCPVAERGKEKSNPTGSRA